MGGNGTYCENLPIFCGKMGATLCQNPQKTLFLGPGGLWGGVYCATCPGKNGGTWGKMEENGG